VAQRADVSPEEPIFVLTGSQLQEIISRAVQPLQDHVDALEATRFANLENKVSALEATQDLHAENQFIQLQLINNLRDTIHKEPQPLQRDRGEILRALLVANGGKMLAKEARQKMRMDKPGFSKLLAVMKGDLETKPYSFKRNQKLLILK
jgi:hypothetical protein